jgi:hypothetical protein
MIQRKYAFHFVSQRGSQTRAKQNVPSAAATFASTSTAAMHVRTDLIGSWIKWLFRIIVRMDLAKLTQKWRYFVAVGMLQRGSRLVSSRVLFQSCPGCGP